MAAALTMGLASCSKDDTSGDGNGDGNNVDGNSVISFAISTEVPGLLSRNATADTEPADAEELNVTGNTLKYVIFSASGGIVEAFGEMPLAAGTGDEAGKWVTPIQDAATIPAGQHYFYVFLNDDPLSSTTDKISSLPAVGTRFDDWVKDNSTFEIPVTYDATTGLPDIAEPNKFLMGTLWKEAKTAPAGGSEAEPELIDLTVGRLSSKIVLTSVAKGATSEMAGDFEFQGYRLGTLSKRIYPAGRMSPTDVTGAASTALNPFTKNQLVISAVHTAPYILDETEPEDEEFNSADFERYAGGETFTGKALNEAFYAAENTTSRQDLTLNSVTVADDALFYGNTTYIQIETVYRPTDDEVHGVEGDEILEAPQTLPTDGTFYTAYQGLERLIFNSFPATIEGLTDIREYVGGKNYHKFAVQDQLEEEGTAKYRVLRNHYYDFRVTAIEDLGDNVSKVDPTEPVEEETFVRLAVTVGKWDKVTPGNIEVR
jgi:hypothetical protein